MRAFKPEHVPLPDLPADLRAVFAAPALDFEIGAGQGLHAIRYAQAHPDRTLVAVERTRDKFARLAQRKAHHALEGLHVVHADAVSIVTHFVRPATLDRVFLLYPNPYPKARQANQRWYNSPFLGELKRKMRPGASLRLATNLDWYAREAEHALVAQWGLVLEERRELGPDDPPRTHFEKKYFARGERCFDLLFRLPAP